MNLIPLFNCHGARNKNTGQTVFFCWARDKAILNLENQPSRRSVERISRLYAIPSIIVRSKLFRSAILFKQVTLVACFVAISSSIYTKCTSTILTRNVRGVHSTVARVYPGSNSATQQKRALLIKSQPQVSEINSLILWDIFDEFAKKKRNICAITSKRSPTSRCKQRILVSFFTSSVFCEYDSPRLRCGLCLIITGIFFAADTCQTHIWIVQKVQYFILPQKFARLNTYTQNGI
jgi:hypothetical protein